MSNLDDIGIDALELTPEVLYPQWLRNLAAQSRAELDALPPRAQPSWYRMQMDTERFEQEYLGKWEET